MAQSSRGRNAAIVSGCAVLVVAGTVAWAWRNPPSVFGADRGGWWILVRADLPRPECDDLRNHLRLVMRHLEKTESRDAAVDSIAYKKIVCDRIGLASGQRALFVGPFASQARASRALVELRELTATRFVFESPHYLRKMYPTRGSRRFPGGAGATGASRTSR